MYQIGEFSKMAQVTTKTLKYYEQCGLLEPVKIDPSSGYRYYGVEQLIPVSRIRTYLDMGFSTPEIKEMLEKEDNTEQFNRKMAALQKELAESERKTTLLSFYKEATKNMSSTRNTVLPLKIWKAGSLRQDGSFFPLSLTCRRNGGIIMRMCSVPVPKSFFPNSLTCFHDEEYCLENNDIELMLFIEKRGAACDNIEYKWCSFRVVY